MRYAEGMDYVFVNGVAVIDGGGHEQYEAGQVAPA